MLSGDWPLFSNLGSSAAVAANAGFVVVFVLAASAQSFFCFLIFFQSDHTVCPLNTSPKIEKMKEVMVSAAPEPFPMPTAIR